ncbi:hypothetical protein PFISCL1PPCAC_21929, partial [Pristionchus fissidentatus]
MYTLHRLKMFELLKRAVTDNQACGGEFWMAVFKLYQHGPNEQWLTVENVTSEEREIICQVMSGTTIHHVYDEGVRFYDIELDREIFSGMVFFRVEIIPVMFSFLGSFD